MEGTQLRGHRGTYTIQRQLGEGGFGQAYLARTEDGREVVTKLLLMSRVPDWKAVELFHREAQVLQKLNHPRIPGYVDHGPPVDEAGFDEFAADNDGRFFIVQEYVEGQPLDVHVRAENRLEPAQAVHILRDILDVLAYLHERTPAIIHRDVKPGNIILSPDGRAHLIDFGTVTAALRADVGSTTAGTFGFSAPEQFYGRAQPSSDLYGLGMTLVAVLAGQAPEVLPFRGNRVDVDAAIGDLRIESKLKLLLTQMTEPNPDLRLASAQESRAKLAGESASASPMTLSDEDRASAARWYDAKHRLDMVSQVLPGPPRFAVSSSTDAVFDPSGRWIFYPGYERHSLIRLEDLEVLRIPGKYDDAHAGFTPDGRTMFIMDREHGRMRVFDHLLEGDLTGESVQTSVFSGDFSSFDIEVVPSPDGRMVAVVGSIHDDQVRLVDRTGAVFQNLHVEDLKRTGFTPDGGALLFQTYEHVEWHGVDGARRTFDAEEVAFSTDGTLEAIRKDGKIEVRRAQNGYLAAANPKVWSTKVASASELRFSPDGALLVHVEHRGDGYRLVLRDARDGQVVKTIEGAGRPGGDFSIDGHQISRNGRVVWAKALNHWVMPAEDTFWAVGAFEVDTGDPIGVALTIMKGDSYLTGFMTWDGLVYAPGNPDYNDYLPGLARARLTGVVPQLDPQAEAAWLDQRERFRFVWELFADGTLDMQASPGDFLRASTGLTHLLPAIVSRASRGGPVRFGAGGDGVNVASLVAACDEIRAMDEAAKNRLFEEMVAEVAREHAEKRAAREMVPRRKAQTAKQPEQELQPYAASVPATTNSPRGPFVMIRVAIVLAFAALMVGAMIVMLFI